MDYCFVDNDSMKYFSGLYVNAGNWNPDENIVLGAIYNNDENEAITVGILRASVIGEAISVSWLYVREDYRRQGVGKGLLNSLVASVKKVYPNSLLQISYDPQNSAVSEFLTNYGFGTDSSVSGYRIKFNYSDIDFRIKQFNDSNSIYFIKDIPKSVINTFNNTIQNSGIIARDNYRIRVPLDSYDSKSICYMKNDSIIAYILLDSERSVTNDAIVISSIYLVNSVPKALAMLFAKLYRLLNKDYPNGIDLIYTSFSFQKKELIQQLFSNTVTSSICYNLIELD